MKKRLLICLAAGLLASQTRAAYIYEENFSVNAAIPDGNPVVSTSSGTVSDVWPGASVLGVTVGLNISGGFNSDLYVSLTAPNGVTVVLVNQPGVTTSDPFGYGGSGMNIILSSSALNSIQTTPQTDGTLLTGIYLAAGDLTAFNGSTANGTWTLSYADLSNGSVSTLNGWSLSIEAVPEPAVWGAASGMALLGMCGWRLWKNRRG